MTQQTRTVEVIVLPIAESEEPCPLWPSAWHGFGTTPNPECQSCHGPGQVPRFKMLREPCHWCIGSTTGKCALAFGPGCQGRGWRAVTTTDALLEALIQEGSAPANPPHNLLPRRSNVEIIHGEFGYLVNLYPYWVEYTKENCSDTLPLALSLALEAALQQEAANAPPN